MSKKKFVHQNQLSFLDPCRPPIWAIDPHSQTILADWLPSAPLKRPGKKWTLDLPDGDQLVCRTFLQHSPWVFVLFHGLTGNSESKYIHRAAREFLKLGHSVVMMNHRNCGEGYGLAKQPYHSGRSDDLGFVIKEIRKKFPRKKVFAIGYSMSANALLLLMSRVVPGLKIFEPQEFEAHRARKTWDLPDLAISVNAPINLNSASHKIGKSINRIYQLSFISALTQLIRNLEKKGLLESAEGLRWSTSVTKFDDIFTAPRSGFKSGQEYYSLCSSQIHLRKIDRPTFCLTSQNDPFIDYRDYLNATLSDQVRLHLEKEGGHMGYLHRTKTPLGTKRWLEYALVEMAQHMIKEFT